MRASRAPEGRGIDKRLLVVSVIVVAVIAAGMTIYFSMGSGSVPPKNEQGMTSPNAALASTSLGGQASAPDSATNFEPTPEPISLPTATLSPNLTPVPGDESTQDNGSDPAPETTVPPTTEPGSLTVPTVLPEAKFGEILEEGITSLRFPDGNMVNTWYSFQVDTETRDITLFFAQYDDDLESILSTVRLEQYTRGTDLETAEVALFFPNGSRRSLIFDGREGNISLDQQYNLPVGPSMFASGLRRALVYYDMNLQDDTGDIEVKLDLDLSGLSLSEGLEFKRLAPETVRNALMELQALVEQIEDQRP